MDSKLNPLVSPILSRVSTQRVKTMKKIELTQGKVAIVDDSDYEKLNQTKWSVHFNGKKHYAVRFKGTYSPLWAFIWCGLTKMQTRDS
jgi:hypothetical protein